MNTLKMLDADDFGLFFNCLTRRYLWDFDPELLELMIRILDRYLAYFNRRTLICSIRDLADGDKSIHHETLEEMSADQQEKHDSVLKQMIKRYLSIELNGSSDKRWNSLKIQELASEGELTAYYRNKKYWMFPSKEDFETWVYENHLDEGDGLPTEEKKLLSVKEDFFPTFASLCLAVVQYSYGRLSYMPSTCRHFILDNIAMFSDGDIRRVVVDLEYRLKEFPICPDGGGKDETKAWESFVHELRRELISREWSVKAAELVAVDYAQFEERIHKMISEGIGSEYECQDTWSKLDGIYRYLMDRKNGCADKKEYKRLIRWGKRYVRNEAIKIWELGEGRNYVKAGRNLYLRRKETGG